MNLQIDDSFRNVTLERCRELARSEQALRNAARRWLLTALVSSLRRAVRFQMYRKGFWNAVPKGKL
jgi:hypothetical protein